MEKDSFYRYIGQRIKSSRENLGMTQLQLSLKCGLHRAYIGQVERGEKKIGVFNLMKIADALDVDIRAFVPGKKV